MKQEDAHTADGEEVLRRAEGERTPDNHDSGVLIHKTVMPGFTSQQTSTRWKMESQRQSTS